MMQLPEIGRFMGKGNTAEVYCINEQQVVKLYLGQFNADLAYYEQFVLNTANDAGACPPAAGDVVKYGNRFGLLMELIDGNPLDVLLMAHPERLEEFSRLMASLHADMHKTTTGVLQTQEEALGNRIKNNRALLGNLTDPVLDYLKTLPAGTAVCHGEFHPKNILVGAAKTVVIDWTNAYKGQPAGDVVLAQLRMLSPYVAKNFSGDSSTFMAAKKAIYNIYINEYTRLTGITEDDLEQWILPCAAAQMHPVKTVHSEWLLKIITQQMENKGL